MAENQDPTTGEEPGVINNMNTPKTYTEQDIQESFNAGVRKANSDWQKDEKFKEFLDWKKSNQSNNEKMTELQNSNNELVNKNKRLNTQVIVAESDVKKEFLKFVASEVMELTNEDVDTKTALAKFKKENPQYFGDVVVKKVQTSASLAGGGSGKQTTNDIMNNILRSRGE